MAAESVKGSIERDGRGGKKFKAARIHFLIDVFAAVAIVDAKALYFRKHKGKRKYYQEKFIHIGLKVNNHSLCFL